DVGELAVVAADRQRVIGDEALGEGQLIALAGLFRFREIGGEVGADKFLARDAGNLYRSLIDIGNLALSADRHEGIEAGLDQAAGVLRCLTSNSHAASADF